MTVGLVLGAGGAFGWAFHLGVLQGVRDALGHEPANAQRIVGTSAGGAIAATLLAGASSGEVLATISTPPDEADMKKMREAAAEFRKHWKRLRPVAPALTLRAWRSMPAAAAAGMLPAGVFPTAPLRRFPTPECAWPPQLWMPSVRMSDGELVVFGRDVHVPVDDAIEATAAVPGMFQPKQIGDERYLDGALRSATNADLLVGEGHDIVAISSPMTRPGRGVIRARARRQLDREVGQLCETGSRVIIVEPDETVMEKAQGFPRTNASAGPEIVKRVAELTATRLTGSERGSDA
ncbi:MAG: hypothetical protein EX269_12950 [Acidimicrobiales bacterium]|nr:MAG: hypothetical protein EX269_12950 [Acidimicrobiales bacterium]